MTQCQIYRIIREAYSEATKNEEICKADLKGSPNDIFYQGKLNEAEAVRKQLDTIIDKIGRTTIMESECTGCTWSAYPCCYAMPEDGDNK